MLAVFFLKLPRDQAARRNCAGRIELTAAHDCDLWPEGK
jgi:hypothetical protein